MICMTLSMRNQNISDKHKSCLQRILKLLLAWKSYSYEIIHQHLLSWSKFHPFYANNLVRCSYRCFFNTAKSNNSIIKLSYTSKFKYYFNKIVKIFNTYQLCILWLIKSLWVLPDDFSRNYVVIFVPSAVKARRYSLLYRFSWEFVICLGKMKATGSL